MTARSTATSIDEFIAEFPPDTRKVLRQIRALIRASAPDATETISYAIATFDLNGRHLVHFGGYERHIGFYPGAHAIEVFREELKPYKSARGSVQFPLGQPLPVDLIRRIVEFRVAEQPAEDQNRGHESPGSHRHRARVADRSVAGRPGCDRSP